MHDHLTNLAKDVQKSTEKSVEWEGTKRVRLPVRNKSMSTKPIFLTYVSLRLTYLKKYGVVDRGLNIDQCLMKPTVNIKLFCKQPHVMYIFIN